MWDRIRGLLRAPVAMLRGSDYKGTWNQAATKNAEDAILTGATPEEFERTGKGDAEMVGRFLRGGESVLDIGCGIGRIEKYLAPRVREMWAVDISGEMIARAQRRLAGLPNVNLREVGNTEFLSSFEAERFDLVFSFLVLQHLAREDAFLYLRDAHRVLKPGGTLVTQFPNLLSAAYTRAFVDQAEVSPRSPGRVRIYTEPEVRHLLGMLHFEVVELWYGGHGEPAEIYVAARKAAK
ncbi:MAG TPA: methyltransferase domain-containing protein [Thermoanaerobaculia bacterium]|jgi:2-polyprenyl-3-methyl-5-hydroxy-6-metoxy-1,4-benzoquinol methylase|nr:methyltransferase domain-containing protein [Thermoanaerobaculia bacterium]